MTDSFEGESCDEKSAVLKSEVKAVLKALGTKKSLGVNGECNQEIRRKLRLRRAAMKELEKLIRCKDVTGDQD